MTHNPLVGIRDPLFVIVASLESRSISWRAQALAPAEASPIQVSGSFGIPVTDDDGSAANLGSDATLVRDERGVRLARETDD